MLQATYEEAMSHVLQDEGGYSNDAGDDGGPTNYGITIHDARRYWKKNATAADVRAMPRSVALQIYEAHYAAPLRYADLPAGVDYAVLDYGINSGLTRSVKLLQRLVGSGVDGVIGDLTVAAAKVYPDKAALIKKFQAARLAFLHNAHNSKGQALWPRFGRGWGRRVESVGRVAVAMVSKYATSVPAPAPTPAEVETKKERTFVDKLLGR